jgi:erythromycin esterase
MTIRVAVLLLCASLLSSRVAAEDVVGTIRDSEGRPVDGAVVAAIEIPTDVENIQHVVTSGPDGRFSLPQLQNGQRYALTVTAKNLLATLSEPFQLRGGESRTMDVTLPRQGGVLLSGVVHMRDGTARHSRILAGRFSQDEGDVFVTDTGDDGRYSIRLPAGSYSLKALRPDGYAASQRVLLETDTTHDFSLLRVFPDEPPAVARWIRSAAIPLRTTDPQANDDDLKALGALVGDAHVVSLGEATHGTREFFQLKHRIIRYLVERKGFTVFGIEATFAGTMAVEDYVTGGDVTIEQALQGLQFWTWRTDEVRDLIEWMRKWNSSHERKVHFLGIDMQDAVGEIRYVRRYLQKIDPTLSPEQFVPLRPLLDRQRYAASGETEKSAVIAAINALGDRVDSVSGAARDRAWAFAHHAVETLHQTEKWAHSPLEQYNIRDRSMAENAKWFLDQEGAGAKMVLWAHNGHVAGESYPAASGGSMGVHLRRLYGSDLLTLGFAFHRGTFRAMRADGGPFDDNKVEPSPVASFDNALSAVGLPLFLLDLRPARGIAAEWLRSPLRSRAIGAVFDPKAPPTSYLATMQPALSFDAVIFVENGSASKVTGPAVTERPTAPGAPAALNLGFDEGWDGEPAPGWQMAKLVSDAGYLARVTHQGCARAGCLHVSRAEKPIDSEVSGVVMQRVDASAFRGKRVRLRGRLRSELRGLESTAQLWLRVDLPERKIGFFDNMMDRAPHSLPLWTPLEIEGKVDENAVAIAFGLLFIGDGDVWLDDVSLEVVP